MKNRLRKQQGGLSFVFVFLLSTIITSLFLVPSVFAAEFSLSLENKNIKVGDQFEAKVLLNTENDSINAMEGVVVFPQDAVVLKEIKSSNSIISFWSQSPQVTGNQVRFSGLVPGGYAGRNGLLLSMVFEAKSENVSTVELAKATALLNDGKGTQASVKVSNLKLAVKGQAIEPSVVASEKDIDPPEEFSPAISRDETIFEGQNFLVFATQDKGSGIDYYEVCEGKSECVKAENLYLLKNQNLDEEITVYAVDKSGNKRMAILYPSKSTSWYAKPLYLAIIGVLFAFIIWRVWKKRQVH